MFCHGSIQDDQQHENEHDAEPEGRRGEAGDREDPHDVVHPGVLLERRHHAERDGQRDRDERRHHGQLEAQGGPELDLLDDGRARPHRGPEVQPHDAEHPGEELLPERPVEPEPGALLVEVLLLGEGALARETQFHDVPGHHPHEKEDEHRHPEEGRDHQEQPLDDVFDHLQARAPVCHSASHTMSSCWLR